MMQPPRISQDSDKAASERSSQVASGCSAGVPPAIAGACPELAEGASRPRSSRWATVVATFFGIGRLHPGPGTWGSAATLVLWAALAHTISPALRTPLAIALALLVTLVGIPAATKVARASGIKDPQFVVIDEVAGQLIALIALPLEWKSFLASLILFRAFDILKPPPVRQLEAIPEGAGIVLDDVAAGLYALAAVHLLLHFGLLT